ncbi:MAG: hypothetical protein KZQ83_12365 [gamma proteobacterium symbiont of Taylorina sp.]|nr:hypothetical protein [gamma proteobacterium symbiont of Taylorina sp.]
MSSKNLLSQLGDFFDMDKKKRRKNAKELKILLKELKQKENKLISKCNEKPGKSEYKMVKREIAIIHAKRKKGLKALKKLIHD